jgi:hypothetical protein
MLKGQKGQAVLELAILGSLIIMAFATVIGLSEGYNRNQSYMQQTFRATLYKAQEANDAGAVSTVDFRRMPNVTNPMELGTVGEFTSGNSVLWSDGKLKADGTPYESKQYFLHNRAVYQLIDSGSSGVLPGSVEVSATNYSTNVNPSVTVFTKNESNGNISTSKSLDASDTIVGSSTVGNENPWIGGDLGSGGTYGRGGVLRR